MNAVGKAIWFIETHFSEDVSLDDVAKSVGVSRYHVVHAFSFATGRSVMGYVRGRRLTEAARSLANGAPDILTVAVEAGYGSHEAFTRAFREQFGVTPEVVRAQRHLCNLELVEPIKLDETFIENLKPARFENGRPLLIAGLAERYTWETSKAIPAQWQRFVPHLNNIPHQIGKATFGVSYNGDDEGNFDYMAGTEVADFSDLPAALGRLRLAHVPAKWNPVRRQGHAPKVESTAFSVHMGSLRDPIWTENAVGPRKYAVFAHREHISAIRRTVNTIWNKWLPDSGHEVADAPSFERFGEAFDFQTGMGGFEIWIPIRA